MIYKLTNRYGWFVFFSLVFNDPLPDSGSLALVDHSIHGSEVSWRVHQHLSGWSHRVKLERVLFCSCRARVQVWTCFCFFISSSIHSPMEIFWFLGIRMPERQKWPKWPRRRPTWEEENLDMFWAIAAAETPQHARNGWGTMLSVDIIIIIGVPLELALVGRSVKMSSLMAVVGPHLWFRLMVCWSVYVAKLILTTFEDRFESMVWQ